MMGSDVTEWTWRAGIVLATGAAWFFFMVCLPVSLSARQQPRRVLINVVVWNVLWALSVAASVGAWWGFFLMCRKMGWA